MVVYTLELRFAMWACDRLTEDADFGKKKSSFQNRRIWGTENPHAYIEKPMDSKQVTVWCGFWSRGIIGQFFFENGQGEAVTVNADRYRAMLNEFLFTKIEEERRYWQHLVSMQDDGIELQLSEETLRPLLQQCVLATIS